MEIHKKVILFGLSHEKSMKKCFFVKANISSPIIDGKK